VISYCGLCLVPTPVASMVIDRKGRTVHENCARLWHPEPTSEDIAVREQALLDEMWPSEAPSEDLENELLDMLKKEK